MKKRLLITGGYGSGMITASLFEDINEISDEWIIEGFLTDIKKKGEYLGKYKVVGSTDEIKDYVNKGYYISYTLHCTTKNKYERIQKFKALNIPLEANATGIHPLAYISPSTKLGYGVIALPYASTSFAPEIGNFVNLYPHSYIAHDSVIGDFSMLTAHSVVGARVKVGEGVHIGLNSSIREDLIIGKYSIIGMGSVVTKNIDDNEIAAGNPAKIIGTNKMEKNEDTF